MDEPRRGIGVITLILLVSLAACGGGSDDVQGDASGDASSADDGDGGGGDENGEISLGDDIPEYFPSDLYLPEEMTVQGVSRTGDAISLTGTFESGDVDAIQADMVAGLEAADYELLTNDDIAAFVKDGVGRVRVRTSEFLGELTVSVDIDTWSDEQLDELRALFAEEVVVSGSATATVGDDTFEADGECRLQGPNRSFYASDVSITIQIDETQDPPLVYADVTTPDGVVFSTEFGADLPYGSSESELFVSGEVVELGNEAAGTVGFTVSADCDA